MVKRKTGKNSDDCSKREKQQYLQSRKSSSVSQDGTKKEKEEQMHFSNTTDEDEIQILDHLKAFSPFSLESKREFFKEVLLWFFLYTYLYKYFLYFAHCKVEKICNTHGEYFMMIVEGEQVWSSDVWIFWNRQHLIHFLQIMLAVYLFKIFYKVFIFFFGRFLSPVFLIIKASVGFFLYPLIKEYMSRVRRIKQQAKLRRK